MTKEDREEMLKAYDADYISKDPRSKNKQGRPNQNYIQPYSFDRELLEVLTDIAVSLEISNNKK